MAYPKKGRPDTWTAADLAKLAMQYPVTADRDLEALFPGRKLKTIKTKAQRLGIKKQGGRWTDKEKQRLLREWPTSTAREIATALERTEWAVINMYRELTGLRKSS